MVGTGTGRALVVGLRVPPRGVRGTCYVVFLVSLNRACCLVSVLHCVLRFRSRGHANLTGPVNTYLEIRNRVLLPRLRGMAIVVPCTAGGG